MQPTDINSGLTVQRVRSVLRYNEKTGQFFWIRSDSRGRNRKRAGHLHASHGYVSIMLDGVSYLAHRLAWFYVKGIWPKDRLDHINGKQSDNRISNLREATQQQNMANQHRLRKNNKSGVRGVSLCKETGRWRAVIVVNRKLKFIGRFDYPWEAKAAYDKAFKELFGEFANTSI